MFLGELSRAYKALGAKTVSRLHAQHGITLNTEFRSALGSSSVFHEYKHSQQGWLITTRSDHGGGGAAVYVLLIQC